MCGSVFKSKNTATLLFFRCHHVSHPPSLRIESSPSCRSQTSWLSFLVHSELCCPCLLSAWVYQPEPPSRRICIMWPRSQQPHADWTSPRLLCLPDHLIVWVSFIFSPGKWAHLRVFSSLSNFPFFSFTPHKFTTQSQTLPFVCLHSSKRLISEFRWSFSPINQAHCSVFSR